MNNILEHQQNSVIINSLREQLTTDRLRYDAKSHVQFAGQYVLQKFIQSWLAHGGRSLELGQRPVFETPKYGTLYECWVEVKFTVSATFAENSEQSYCIIPPLVGLELLRTIEWQTRASTTLLRLYPEQILQKILRMPYHKRRRYLRALGGLKAQYVRGSVAGGVMSKTMTVRIPLLFDMFDDPRTQPDTLATVETQFMLEGRQAVEWLGKVDSSTVEAISTHMSNLYGDFTQSSPAVQVAYNDYQAYHGGGANPQVNGPLSMNQWFRQMGTISHESITVNDLNFHYYYRIYRNPFRIQLRKALHKGESPARYVDFSYYLEANTTQADRMLSYIGSSDVDYEAGKITTTGANTQTNDEINATLRDATRVTDTIMQSASNHLVLGLAAPAELRPQQQNSIPQNLTMTIELRVDQPVVSSVIALRFGKANPMLKAYFRQMFALPRLDKQEIRITNQDYTVRFLEASSVLWEATRYSLGWENEITGLSFHETLEEVNLETPLQHGVLHDTDVDLSKAPPLGYIVIDWGQFFKYKGMRTAITFKNLSNPKFEISIPQLVDNFTVSKLFPPVFVGNAGYGTSGYAQDPVTGAFARNGFQITGTNVKHNFDAAYQAANEGEFGAIPSLPHNTGTELARDLRSKMAFQSPLDARVAVLDANTLKTLPPTTTYDFHIEVYHQVIQMMTVSYDADFRQSVIDREVEN